MTTYEVVDKMDMFQYRFRKLDEFGWWYLECFSSYACTQFTSTGIKGEFQTHGVHLTLADPEHQHMNGQVKVTWRPLRRISHSLMVHARVLEAYIHFALMYTADHILPVLPIKDLINKYGEPTTSFKLETSKKPSVSY